MARSRLVWLYFGATALMVMMVVAFWIWASAITWLKIPTWGVGGRVTAVLWTLYLCGVPIAGVIALLSGAIAARRYRSAWLVATLSCGFVAMVLAFWFLSLALALAGM